MSLAMNETHIHRIPVSLSVIAKLTTPHDVPWEKGGSLGLEPKTTHPLKSPHGRTSSLLHRSEQ